MASSLRAVVALSLFFFTYGQARSQTTISIIFVNSGPMISALSIQDTVCNVTRWNQPFAANDGATVDGFCVQDASLLQAIINISIDDTLKFESLVVPANSNVDVWTGTVTPNQ
jgi:hypothetical protein